MSQRALSKDRRVAYEKIEIREGSNGNGQYLNEPYVEPERLSY